jgi:putative salt-induced outer membrane protein YdiY
MDDPDHQSVNQGAIIMTRSASGLVRGLAALALTALLAGLVPAVRAEETEGLLGPWKATAEVSYVVTGGNTATSAFSLGTTFTRKWAKDILTFKSYVLRSNATTFSRRAVGTEEDYTVVEESIKALVAENYMLAGLYERRISKRLLGQAGLNWDRNRFAGLASRFMLTAGLGYAIVESKNTQVKTDAGLTYTLRKYLDRDSTSFAGFRFNLFGEQKLSEKSSFASQFVFDENLKNTKDWRFDWTNSLTASISKSLALKTSLRMIYTRVPALQSLALFDLEGLPTGLSVDVPLERLDTFLTTSIVINF